MENDLVASMKRLGEWIRKNRKMKALTLEALASRAGMSKQYLSMIERAVGQPVTGRPVVPSREKITNICGALDISPAEPFRIAGYAMNGEDAKNGENTADGDEYNLQSGIVISFLKKSRLTDEQKARIIDHLNLIVRGVVSEEIAKLLQTLSQYQPPEKT